MKEKVKNKVLDAYRDAKKHYIPYSFMLILILIFAIVSFILNFNIVIIEIFIYLMILLYLIKNKKIIHLKNFLLTTIMAIVWMAIANSQYKYNKDFIKLFDINLFPLFAWALGLFVFYLLYSYLIKHIKIENFYYEFLLVWSLYIVVIIWFETVGYHTFGVHNIGASEYPGLPLCNCIHAPIWMQISYLSMGSLFYLISRKITSKDRNSAKKIK